MYGSIPRGLGSSWAPKASYLGARLKSALEAGCLVAVFVGPICGLLIGLCAHSATVGWGVYLGAVLFAILCGWTSPSD